MRLIDSIQKQLHGILFQHIDIVIFVIAGIQKFCDRIDPPHAVRDIPLQVTVLQTAGQVDQFSCRIRPIWIHSFVCHDRDYFLAHKLRSLGKADPDAKHFGNSEAMMLQRSPDIHNTAVQMPLFQAIRGVFDRPVRISCREMRVVQDPDLHITLFCLIDNDGKILPPLITDEIRMRSRFHADCADA